MKTHKIKLFLNFCDDVYFEKSKAEAKLKELEK